MEALPDELVEAILLRSPPDDPVRLVRAALVCKRWCRLVSGRGFRRRLRQFHRTAPMLGLLHNTGEEGSLFLEESLFVPTSSFSPLHGRVDNDDSKRFRQVIDARHGRVLLHGMGSSRRPGEPSPEHMFFVWDPITGDETMLPMPPRRSAAHRWSATAVLCTGGGGGDDDDACDQLDCHRGPFQVVIVCCNHRQTLMFACVYSSATGAWRKPDSSLLLHHGSFLDREAASAFVCGSLLFKFGSDNKHLLRYDLASEEMCVIDPPDAFSGRCRWCITTDQDGRRLGYATVEGYKLYFWSREASHGGHWTETRVIELEKLLLPVDVDVGLSIPLGVVAFADGVGVFVVDNSGRLFTIDLKSSQVKEVCDVSDDATGDIPYDIFPYMTFLTPTAQGAASI